ncbi:MAG TPA: hydantoinase/carbamoylase family amidase, partial [Methylomirabilota bacterium]|nr:hydantoinase/carbamoylase family amidase [Methylomirabilota bacterium]
MLSVSSARLHARIAALARFGALPGGGVTRSCWSPAHEEARGWLLGEIKSAGLTPWVDPAGNVFGGLGLDRFDGATPAVLTGSHIDTVPEGGTLDGALGVLAGLECLQTIREAGAAPRKPLAVAAWSDEEGRYGSLFGSRAFCGRLDAAAIPTMAAADGERLVDVMTRAGFDPLRVPEARAPVGAVDAYVELHIEQGPRLEEAGIPIGIVDAIVGIRRARVVFAGQADHAGTTPMERRRDAFLGAADYALKARELVVARGGPRVVTNFGVVQVHPGVSNIVPGRAELVHEMRDPDAAVLERLAGECAELARDVATARGLAVEVRPMSTTMP